MIKSREEILQFNPVFTQHLLDIQDAKYNPRQEPLVEGDTITDDSGHDIRLTVELAKRINEEDYEDYAAIRDTNPIKHMPQIDWIMTKSYSAGKANTDKKLKQIVLALSELSRSFQQEDMVIMADLPVFWMGMPGEYPISTKTLSYFLDICDEQFMGGFKISWEDMEMFIPRLFELITENEDIQEVCMGFETLPAVFSICRHGDLHADYYSEEKIPSISDCISKYLKEVVQDD